MSDTARDVVALFDSGPRGRALIVARAEGRRVAADRAARAGIGTPEYADLRFEADLARMHVDMVLRYSMDRGAERTRRQSVAIFFGVLCLLCWGGPALFIWLT